MDKIKEFEINLDITDRERLYDYVRCQMITKPEGSKTWDLDHLKQYGQVEDYFTVEDENAMVRVNLMDKAIEDTRKLEKKKKEDQGVQTNREGFPNIFDTNGKSEGFPLRLLPIYKPGEIVKGHVVLNISEALTAKKLSLRFAGRAVVCIRVYRQHGYYDDKKEVTFAEYEILLWQKGEDNSGDDLLDKFSVLSHTSSPARSKQIPPGVHRFPFEFPIPASVPQSCPPVITNSADFAHLIYRLKANIVKDKTKKSGNISTCKGIWLETDYDIGNEPDVMQPINVEETLDTGVVQFWKAGKLTVKVTVPQSAFLRGQSIPVSLEIDNQTNGEIKKVKARIRMHGKAQHNEHRVSMSHPIEAKGVKVADGPIAPGMCPSYHWTLPWDFSDCCIDGNLLPVGDLNYSVLLDIHYEIIIEVKRKGLHRNMEIHIPIKVGNLNSRAESHGTSHLNGVSSEMNSKNY